MHLLTKRLLTWYEKNRRDLPWRKTDDPYKIWVSEVMLQQTRVEAVVDKYCHFIETYPTISSLAQAREREVLDRWQGLGYYSRARRLLEAAKILGERPFPEDYKEFLSLPGVGEYTASAVFSIAFHEKRIALDGNLLRIGVRLMAHEGDSRKSKVRQEISAYLKEYLPHKKSGDFNQALMDLGSAICTPKNPNCKACPLVTLCIGHKKKMTHRLPLPTRKPSPRKVMVDVFFIISPDGEILLRRRDYGSFLQGLWELPFEEKGEETNLLVKEKKALYHAKRPLLGESLSMEYLFSHKHWFMRVEEYRVERRFIPVSKKKEEYRWVSKEELDSIGIATVFRRVLERKSC